MKEVAVMATENSAKELAYKTRERLTGKAKEFIEKTVIKPLEEWLSWNRSLAVAAEGGGRVQAQYMMRDTAKNAVKKEVAGEAKEKALKRTAKETTDDTVEITTNIKSRNGYEYKKPVSGESGKEATTDVPSWAKGKRPYKGESGKDFAKRLMDEKYGKGNYKTGPNSEYNKIKKWGDRGFE